MKLQELLNEFIDCHDKQRLQYLKSEIAKIEVEYIMRCYDISEND